MDIQQPVSTRWSFDQSIYTNSLAPSPERLDLMSVAGIEPSAPLQVLETVLERKKLPVRLKVNEVQNQLFWHIYGEQRSQDRIRGSRPLGLGYPIVLAGRGEERSAMPVFIWSLRLEPSLYRVNEWELYYSPADPCRINPALLDWMSQNDLPGSSLSIPPHPDKGAVGLLLRQITSDLGLESDNQSLALTPWPSSNELAEEGPDQLLWSGVIGIFARYEPSSPEEKNMLVEELPETGYPYGLLPQTPEQAGALRTARTQRASWVEGISGTGKTHLLTQMAGMALVNGQKCLVVSPSASNLKEIQDRLAERGLQRLQYLIRNPETETGMLLDFFRAMGEGAYLPPEFDTAQYNLYLDRCERERKKLDERYAAVHQQVFGEYNWTETVGLFLASNRKIGKELLSMQLYTQDFQFTFPEFEILSEAITRSQPLYDQVRTLNHPLGHLHPGLFLDREKDEGRVLIADRLEVFLAKAVRLQRRYFAKVNQYGESLRKHYDQHYRELNALAGAIREKMAEGKNQFGQPFEETSERTLRFYGFFSKKQKEILQARQQIEGLYTQLKQKFELFGYFDFLFPAAGSKPVAELRPTVVAFEESLDKWQHKHSAIIQDNIQRLSRKTVHPRLHMEDDIEELEDDLEHLLNELNETMLFAQPFEHKMLTIPKRQRYLESVIEQLEETKRDLADYHNFYEWQRNWLQLGPQAQKLVRALIKVKPADWKAAFRSWYLHHCLNLAHTPQLPQTDDGLNTFVLSFRELQPLLTPLIAQQWDKRRLEAMRRLKSNRKLYQLLSSRPDQEVESPEQVRANWRRGLESVSEVLPVLLIGEAVLSYLPQDGQKIFDYILVDEAHQLNYSQLAMLQDLGQRLVVFSNPNLENLTGKDQWPQKWREQGIPSTQLSIIQQWRPPNLRQLAAAQALENILPQSFPIVFEQVEGRYDEESQMNSAEAESLIKMLNRIEKTPQRTYPTVGIVCMTKGQRSLVNQLIFQIKKQDSAGADTLRQLERNGLGVYFPDELSGLHFDILIFSGTWGVANTRGGLTRDLDLLDDPRHVALLHLLMGRATHSVYVLNSIPMARLEQLSKTGDTSGKKYYAHYLLYLQAAANHDRKKQIRLIESLRPEQRPAQPPEAVFPQQIGQELGLYLRDQQLETNYEDTYRRFPLIVRSKEKDKRAIVIQPDGFFASTTATDYTWEYEQRKQLDEQGYSFLPAWSVKWWRETSLEAKRMAATLLNLLE